MKFKKNDIIKIVSEDLLECGMIGKIIAAEDYNKGWFGQKESELYNFNGYTNNIQYKVWFSENDGDTMSSWQDQMFWEEDLEFANKKERFYYRINGESPQIEKINKTDKYAELNIDMNGDFPWGDNQKMRISCRPMYNENMTKKQYLRFIRDSFWKMYEHEVGNCLDFKRSRLKKVAKRNKFRIDKVIKI